ncbi:MAG TPA: helix-turn-helix domain-containing protein [Candidatus Paceibacterota bacterium]|nr:helix-turn-helix domain-containing protein [Candidatus Paceibacterota bacterium]
MTPLVKRLTALGIPEKDAMVYLSLLALGPATVQKITKETGLNRSSLYVILDRLLERGLASIAGERGVRAYVAVPPERLIRIAKERLEHAVLTRQNLETLLPEIETLRKISRHKPRMLVLTGIEGLQRGFEEALENKERVIRIFSSAGKIAQSLPGYLPTFIRERFRRGIRMYGIHPDDKAGREMIKHVPGTIDELTFVPSDRFKFPSDLGIFDDKIAFMSHEPPLCVAIESRAIADVMKTVFDLAREEARRIGRDPYARHG